MDEQRRIDTRINIRENLKKLDCLEGEGIFPHLKRSITLDSRFLFVSYGGAGGDVLYALKKKLQNNLWWK